MCLLYCNELFFPYVFEDVDSVTLGPEKLEGPNGSTLGEAVWLDPVVNWKHVQGKVQPCRIQSIVRSQETKICHTGGVMQSSLRGCQMTLLVRLLGHFVSPGGSPDGLGPWSSKLEPRTKQRRFSGSSSSFLISTSLVG